MAQRHQAFRNWLEANGGFVHGSLDLFAQLPGGDRGVVAREAISEGEQLLVVPAELCMHVQDGSRANAVPAAPALHALAGWGLGPFLSTVLYMLAERAQGAKSRFAPYLDLLPARHDCLMSWTAEEKAELQGTDLEDRAKGESAAETFVRQVEPLIRQRPDVWPPDVCGGDAFEWCCGMVQSRAFHLVEDNWVTQVQSECTDLYMLTAIDMVNHSSFPHRRGSSLLLVTEPLTVQISNPPREITLHKYFSMKAERDIAVGEQVLHTYGDLSDAQLLQTYGFVEETEPAAGAESTEQRRRQGLGNPHNVAFISADVVADACAAMAVALGLSDAVAGEAQGERRTLLSRLGVLQNVAVVSVASPLSEEILTAAQVLLMPEEDWKEYREEFGGEAAARELTTTEPAVGLLGRACLDDARFREVVCMALLRAAQVSLRRYATTAEQDVALLASRELPWRQRCAVRVRLGEKRLLEALKDELQALLAEGVSSEEEEGDDAGSSDLDCEEGNGDTEGSSEEGSEGEEGDDAAEAPAGAEDEQQPIPKRRRQ